ncbi:MAG: hypothetical protein J6A01_03620 [Proteobacteria bacterium]|nr:hypothetical protein [Pseudomonadota bacterium]
MLLNPADFDRKSYEQIVNLYRMRPIPQPPVWENVARVFKNKGLFFEACCVIDSMVQKYGKVIGRASYERVFGIPMIQCGRGLNHNCPQSSQPAIFTLRDHTLPLWIGNRVLLRCGCNVLMAQPDSGKIFMLGAISDNPVHLEKTTDPLERSPLVWLTIGNFLVYAHGTEELSLVEIPNEIPSDADPVPLRRATIKFESNIKNLCGPLEDGTFFVTLESPIPILSDICRLCALNLDEIRAGSDAQLIKNILLTNVEQTLRGDCCACKDGFLTCGGGMQNREVRWIEPDGSWTTRFVHESPVMRMIMSEKGPVSLDESGHAILWDGTKAVDDFAFDNSKIPEIFKDNLNDTAFSVNWMHKRLYLTLTTPPQSTLLAALKASHSCCLTANDADEDYFVKHLYHSSNASLAMLADGSFYFWDLNHDCVSAPWQLSQECADQKDWHELLAVRSPAIEQDPRIRLIRN